MLANRIALLKQEEMKTWKKIEETKKRTGDITTLKKRNEDKVQKVSSYYHCLLIICFDCRKYSTSNWITNRNDKWVRVITCFPNRDMMKRKKFRMPCCFRRRKKQSNQNWLKHRTSRSNSWITRELDKRIKWRTR